jgi:hypothetical protein
MLAAATHPNIVELKDHGMTEGYVWLTMPLYEGETLAERLARGTLELREASEIFLPVARGIAALHARGLRHQDVKPENIYLANFVGQLHPVLLDLGVAVEQSSSFIAGTALFGAPEQLAALGGIGDEAELSAKMDTYCLASTLLYALVGEEHFPGAKARTPFDIVSAFETRATEPLAPEALPELTGTARDQLRDAFCRWLARDPDERCTTDEMASELDVLLEKEREEARAEVRSRARQRANYRRVQTVLGALVLAGLAGGYYLFTKRETLQLAAELNQAKDEQAASFANLEQCQMAHTLSKRKAGECNTARDADSRDHRATYAALVDKNEDLGNTMMLATGKLQICEEESEKARTEWDEQRATLESKHAEEATSARAQLEAAETAKRTCEQDIERTREETNQCQRSLAACRVEGDDVYSPPPAPKPSGEVYPE